MTDLALHQESDDEERRRLGDRLREARKYLGLKQEEVATYLKIPRTALTDIESGQRRVEAIELTRLAKLYRQPVAYFTARTRPGRTCRWTSHISHGKRPTSRSRIAMSSGASPNTCVPGRAQHRAELCRLRTMQALSA
jgi:transcriptional regulator with XRE-family HTH domain